MCRGEGLRGAGSSRGCRGLMDARDAGYKGAELRGAESAGGAEGLGLQGGAESAWYRGAGVQGS